MSNPLDISNNGNDASTEDFRVSFSKAISSGVDPNYFTIIPAIGAGMAVSQAAGLLSVTTGTTANAETVIRSNRSFTGDIIFRYGLRLSQRIANQSFFVELVDVIGDGLTVSIDSATAITVNIPQNPFTAENVGQSVYVGNYTGTGVFISGRYPIASVDGNNVVFTVAGFTAGVGTVSVFGYNYHHVLYDGTTATSTKYDAQRKGYATGDSAVTITSTASNGHSGIISMINSVAQFLDHGPTGGVATARADRTANLPVDADKLYIQIRAVNGSTAPASTTTLGINYISLLNAEAPIFTLAGMLPSSQNAPLFVTFPTTPTVTADTELPVAAALADATATPTTPIVGAAAELFNNATWDRQRGNYTLNLDTSSAKTATGSGATGTNHNFRGAEFFVNVTAVSGTTPTLTVRLQESYDGTNFRDVDTTNLQTASITASGIHKLVIYPAIATAANASLNSVLPRTFRLAWTIGGTSPSFTFATWVNFIS